MSFWIGLLLLAVLGTGAFAVFTLLPGWVEQRKSRIADTGDAGAPVSGTAPAIERLPLEAEDPAAVAPAPGAPHREISPEPSPRPSGHASPEPRSRPRASTHPADRPFRTAMSEGLAALDRQDWTAAREALTRARSIRPDAPQIADALARVETGEKVAALALYRKEGREQEAAERWRQAAASYQAALALDPTVTFAREGLFRVTARAEMAETLQYHLDHPDRLSSLAVLDEVAALVDRAREVEPAGPRHLHQVRELSQRVKEWSRPVTTRLVSDGRTQVTLFRVGRLGTFTQRELELRPGTYTFVGHRKGYRDVRRELVIRPGRRPDPLRVTCEEEI